MIFILSILVLFYIYFLIKEFFKLDIESKNLIALGIIVFLIVPLFVDFLVIGDKTIKTNQTNEQWSTFLGSYLGGGIGGIIALFGVNWQINRNEKKDYERNTKGFASLVSYILDKNLITYNHILNNKDEYYIKSYLILSRFFSINEEQINKYGRINFNIDKKLNEIFSIGDIELAKMIADFEQKILKYNSEYDKVSKITLENNLTKEKKDNNEEKLQIIIFLQKIYSLIINLELDLEKENENMLKNDIKDIFNNMLQEMSDNILCREFFIFSDIESLSKEVNYQKIHTIIQRMLVSILNEKIAILQNSSLNTTFINLLKEIKELKEKLEKDYK